MRIRDKSGAEKTKDLIFCHETAFLCRDMVAAEMSHKQIAEARAFSERVDAFVQEIGLGEDAARLLKNLSVPGNRVMMR